MPLPIDTFLEVGYKIMRLLSSHQLEIALELLSQGKLIVFPTETVYGLGAPLSNIEAVQKIFQVKQRAKNHPLTIHVAELTTIEKIALDIPDDFYRLATQFFPGPLTIVLKKTHQFSPIISGGLDTIAIRMPRHPIATQLISLLGEPLVATSANLSGKPSSTTVDHVLSDFSDLREGAVIDGGKTEYGIESTVISLATATPLLLRLGAICQEEIESCLHKPLLKAQPFSFAYSHLTSQRSVCWFQDRRELEKYLQSAPPLRRFFITTYPLPGFHQIENRNLYTLLRLAEEEKVEEIAILDTPHLSPALRERLVQMGRVNQNEPTSDQ